MIKGNEILTCLCLREFNCTECRLPLIHPCLNNSCYTRVDEDMKVGSKHEAGTQVGCGGTAPLSALDCGLNPALGEDTYYSLSKGARRDHLPTPRGRPEFISRLSGNFLAFCCVVAIIRASNGWPNPGRLTELMPVVLWIVGSNWPFVLW
jgi:hypothetical protein